MGKQKITFEVDEQLDKKVEDDIKELLEREDAENIEFVWEEE